MILTNRRLWPLAPVIIAGVSYLLGSWGAVPRTFTHEDVSGHGIITVDSFSDEAIAMGLLCQRAQTLGLEYLKSSGEHFERWSFYEKGYERWLRNSGLVDEAENRRRYQDQAGAPPEFEVDAWIRRYQEGRVRLSLEPVTASLDGDLLSLLRKHQRHAHAGGRRSSTCRSHHAPLPQSAARRHRLHMDGRGTGDQACGGVARRIHRGPRWDRLD
jgi:hypothetical protein